ncbi:MAG: hypothetical protein ABI407_14705 [Bradyrhizobium sp.]
MPITTNHPDLIPEKYEIVADNLVKVSLRDKAGGLVIYTMEFAMMVESVNMATALLNSNVAKFLAKLAA